MGRVSRPARLDIVPGHPFPKHGTIKDASAQMRHTSPDLTLRTHVQAIPESARNAVNRFEQSLASISGSDTIQEVGSLFWDFEQQLNNACPQALAGP